MLYSVTGVFLFFVYVGWQTMAFLMHLSIAIGAFIYCYRSQYITRVVTNHSVLSIFSINTVCGSLWALQIANGHCKSIYSPPMSQSQLHLWLHQKVQQYLFHFVPMETVHYLTHIALKRQIPAEDSPAWCYGLLGLHG